MVYFLRLFCALAAMWLSTVLCVSGEEKLGGRSAEPTGLRWAAMIGNLALARAELERGADPNAGDEEGKKPLHHAVVDYDTAVLLIGAGAGVDARDQLERTPLFEATGAADPRMIRLLLSKGADIEAKDQEGQTPLHRAVAWGNTHAVEVLLVEGADINTRDGEGNTPMEKALRGNITAVAILLGDRGALKKDGKPATEILPLKW